MGKILKLSGITITNPNAPSILQYDAIESKGSLLLFDGAAPTAQFVGIPEVNSTIPNVLRGNAVRLTGSDTGVDLTVFRKSTNPHFLVERTPKGGLHGIVSQTSGVSTELTYLLHGQNALGDYIRANSSHQFYTSIWSKITRAGITTGGPQSPFHFTNSLNVVDNYYFYYREGTFRPSSGNTFLARYSNYAAGDHDASIITSIPINRFSNGAFSGAVGTPPTVTDRIQLGVGTFGAWASLNVNKAPSRIIYRAYIEDLTVSGRTYAQVHALDKALYDAAFAPGGKFHGDTFTDPATIP